MGDDGREAPTGIDDVAGATGDVESVADRYRRLVALSPDAICVHQDGVVVYANDAAARMAGMAAPQEFVDRPITDFVHPSSLPHMVECLLEIGDRTGAYTEPSEVTMVDAAGQPVIMEVTSVGTLWRGRPAYQVILRDSRPQAAARATLQRQAALVDHVTDAIVSVDDESVVRSWNPAAERLYGRKAGAVIDRDLTAAVGTDVDLGGIVALGGESDAVHHRGDGRPLRVRMTVSPLDDGYLVVCSEQSSRQALNDRLSTILSALGEAVIVVGADSTVQLANPAALEMLRLAPSAVPGEPLSALSLQFDDDASSPIGHAIAGARSFSDRPVTIEVDDVTRWFTCSCRVVDDPSEGTVAVVSFRDMTEHHQRLSELAFDATHDHLTGLLNRAGILQALSERIDAAEADPSVAAVFYLDLDNFKLVNDSLGHSEGDLVLQAVAQRLDDATPQGACVGRIGGDEFVMIVDVPQSPADAANHLAAVSDRIHHSVEKPIEVGHRIEHVSISIGVTTCDRDDARVPVDLLRDASIALHTAKTGKHGDRGPHVVFVAAHRDAVQRRQQLEQDLRRAVKFPSGQLRMAYQPIVDRSGAVAALEALLRWQHPVLGEVSPSEFIPIAEQSDLIDAVSAFVVATATREFSEAGWGSGVWLCINTSRRELDDPGLVDRLVDALKDAGLPPHALCVEVTESYLADTPEAAQVAVRALRAAGMSVALDDFGTGASSLTQLANLPVNILKAPQPFVDAMRDNPESAAIITGIIEIAHTAGMLVIAEGVEWDWQVDEIFDIGADYIQGFAVRRPAPIDELTAQYMLRGDTR